jgi:hypothetical protein
MCGIYGTALCFKGVDAFRRWNLRKEINDKTEDDPENFYMEREWRSLRNIHFEIDDIHRIILPRSFSKRFRNDVPEYFGEITFSDEYVDI